MTIEDVMKQFYVMTDFPQDAPWLSEPDRKQWIDPVTGLDCLIVRGPAGALCGYVGVQPGHPWYGRHYNELDGDIEVHGGLTFSNSCEGQVCHDVLSGFVACEDVWWLGFDCAHLFDLMPIIYKLSIDIRGPMSGEYRNIRYVEEECQKLASQILSANPKIGT